jgi:hypothetical protein
VLIARYRAVRDGDLADAGIAAAMMPNKVGHCRGW